MINIEYIFNNLRDHIVIDDHDNDLFYIGLDIYDNKNDFEQTIYICSHAIQSYNNNCFYIFTESVDTLPEQNYFVLDGSIDYLSLFIQLQHVFLEYNQQMNHLSLFTQGLIKGYGIKELIRIASQIFNNPIILTNSSYKVLALEENNIKYYDYVFDMAKRYGYCNSVSIKNFEEQGITAKVEHSDKAVNIDYGVGKEITRVVSKIKVHNKIIAYIGVLEVTHKLTKQESDLLDSLCSILANELRSSKEYVNGTNIIYESIIVDLIENNIADENLLKDRLDASKWSLHKHIRCLYMSYSEFNDRIYNIDYLVSSINDIPGAKAISYNNDIFVIVSYNTNKEWHSKLDSLERMVKFIKCKICISTRV